MPRTKHESKSLLIAAMAMAAQTSVGVNPALSDASNSSGAAAGPSTGVGASVADPAPATSAGLATSTGPSRGTSPTSGASSSGLQTSPSASPNFNNALSGGTIELRRKVHFTLADAVGAAIKASTGIMIAKNNVRADKSKIDAAEAATRPTLSAGATGSRYDQATDVKFGTGPAVQVLGSHSEALSLNAGEQIDLSGALSAATTMAKLQLLADQLQVLTERNARILQAKELFYDVLRTQHLVDVAVASHDAANAQQVIANRLFEQQVGQKIDLLRADTQVAIAQQQVVQAQTKYDIAKSNFNDTVGNPMDTDVVLVDPDADKFGYISQPTTHIKAPIGNTPLPEVGIGNSISNISLTEATAQALSDRPDLAMAALDVKIAQTGITIARTALSPTLRLNAGGFYFPTTSFQTPRQRTADITATFTIPIYDGGVARDHINEAKEQQKSASQLLDSGKTNVTNQVRNAYLIAVSDEAIVRLSSATVEQAVAAQQLAQVRYEGQVGLYLEVIDSQAALVQAEADQLNAFYNYETARAQFENAIGAPTLGN